MTTINVHEGTGEPPVKTRYAFWLAKDNLWLVTMPGMLQTLVLLSTRDTQHQEGLIIVDSRDAAFQMVNHRGLNRHLQIVPIPPWAESWPSV